MENLIEDNKTVTWEEWMQLNSNWGECVAGVQGIIEDALEKYPDSKEVKEIFDRLKDHMEYCNAWTTEEEVEEYWG